MRADASLEKRSLQLDHKKKMDNLKAKHRNEREKVDNQHNHNLNQIKNQNRVEIDEKRLAHKAKFIEQSKRQEKTLEDLKSSLDAVKERTTKEINQIREAHAQKKIDESKLFKLNYQQNKDKKQMQLQDIEHEAKINLQKLERNVKQDEKELRQTSLEDKRNQRSNHLTKMSMTKEDFKNKKLRAEGKFSTNLRRQTKTHKDQLAKQERTHHSNLLKRKRLFENTNKIVERNGKASNDQMRKRYEKNFEEHFTKNEKRLKVLSHHKERIINDLKSMFKKEVKLSLEKDNDPFYQNNTLTPRLSESEDGYTLKVDVPKHDADKVKLTASGRELKLAMDRDYSFTKKSEDGSTKKISKSETRIQKIPVDKIIDSKTIDRSYKDGELTFTIGLS